MVLAIWSLVPLPFLNPAWTSGSSRLKPGLENFEHYFTSVWDECNCAVVWAFWHCLSLGLEWKLTFSSPVATAEFSKFARILNEALSQHHLFRFEIVHWNPITSTSFVHSDASSGPCDFAFQDVCCRWVITPSWLSGELRSFLYSSSVYSCHLFLLSSASFRSISFLSFIVSLSFISFS